MSSRPLGVFALFGRLQWRSKRPQPWEQVGDALMRWLTTAGFAWLSLLCEAAHAQLPISPILRGPLSEVQLNLVSGRLALTARRVVRTRIPGSSSGLDRTEQIMVDMTGPHPAVDYQMVTSQWQLLINIRNQTQFRIARELRSGEAKVAPFEFRQNEQGELWFVWGSDAQRQRRFATLWHLLLVEPDAARSDLLPILEFFRPGWNLAASTDRITDALFANAHQFRAMPREQWAQLVSQLTDTHYARREAADRRLRAEGKGIIYYLETLRADQLDFEQRRRIGGIRRSLARGDDSDAPESLAAWLGTDPRVWLALLNHADLGRRQIAARQLSLLLGEEISFDAVAPLEARKQQIETLRQRMEPKPG